MPNPQSGELVHGPQDGARIRTGSSDGLPAVVYVGTKWLGDGHAAWSCEWSARKPAKYWRLEDESGRPTEKYLFVDFKE